jgi:hypothetical protein
MKDRSAVFKAYVSAAARSRVVADSLESFLRLPDDEQDTVLGPWVDSQLAVLQKELEAALDRVVFAEAEITKLTGIK